MNKVKRYMLVGLTVGTLAMTSTGCVDSEDVQSEAYQVIQNGQNTIQEVGNDVRDAGEKAGLNEPVDLSGVTDVVEDIEKKTHQACVSSCRFAFGPGEALENSDNLDTCLKQCGDS